MSFRIIVAGYRTTDEKRNKDIREEINIINSNKKVGALRMEDARIRKFVKEYETTGKI